MKRSILVASSIFILFSIQACDSKRAKNYNERTSVDDVGLNMIKMGVESGNAEIRLSQLAQKNSQNPKIVDFAKMMIADHTSVGNDLKKLANDKRVNISDSLTVEHNQLADSLSVKKGVDFDRQYLQAMVNDHKKTVTLFKEASTNSDRTINKFASKTLPKFEAHLKQAEELSAKLK